MDGRIDLFLRPRGERVPKQPEMFLPGAGWIPQVEGRHRFSPLPLDRGQMCSYQALRVVLVKATVYRGLGKPDPLSGDPRYRLLVAAQRPSRHPVEVDVTLAEVLPQPTRLSMSKFGQPVIVIGTKCRLGMSDQK